LREKLGTHSRYTSTHDDGEEEGERVSGRGGGRAGEEEGERARGREGGSAEERGMEWKWVRSAELIPGCNGAEKMWSVHSSLGLVLLLLLLLLLFGASSACVGRVEKERERGRGRGREKERERWREKERTVVQVVIAGGVLGVEC